MDEITTTGASHVAEWVGGEVKQYTVHPEDFGIPVSTLDELLGADAKGNARLLLDLFEGKKGSKQDIVLLNAGAVLHAAGAADTIAQGIELARQSIDQGKAMEKLQALIRFSNRERRSGPE